MTKLEDLGQYLALIRQRRAAELGRPASQPPLADIHTPDPYPDQQSVDAEIAAGYADYFNPDAKRGSGLYYGMGWRKAQKENAARASAEAVAYFELSLRDNESDRKWAEKLSAQQQQTKETLPEDS